MTVAQGTDLVLAAKIQSGLGSAASGAGATLLEVRPSQGLQRQVASIESSIIRRNGNKLKQRNGSIQAPAAYETELRIGNLDLVYGGIQGCVVTAPIVISNTDVTSAAISGTGTVLTGASGSFISLGLKAGMRFQLSGMATSANNGKWVGILAVTASTLSLEPGILVDETADTSFTLTTAKCYITPTPRVKQYFTVEEYLASIDRSKLGTDMRFTSFNFNAQPDAPIVAGFGLMGRAFQALSSGSSPNFTSPSDPSLSGMLSMLDGALYANGVVLAVPTSLTFGLQAQPSLSKLLTSRTAADVGMGMFGFTGQMSALVQDFDALDTSVAENRVSLFVVASQQPAVGTDFVSFYVGDASYGQVDVPVADGDVVETITLYAGSDTRGSGYADSTMVISTSAP